MNPLPKEFEDQLGNGCLMLWWYGPSTVRSIQKWPRATTPHYSSIKLLPKQVDGELKKSMAVDFSFKRLQFWSCGFVCQTKKVNACGHIPVHDLTMAYSVNSKRQTLICAKSILESFKGSILNSIIVECRRKLSVEVFGASTKMVDSKTPNCEQQAVPAKSARRKECDHVRSAFRLDK